MEHCTNVDCGLEVQLTEEKCPACGAFLGYRNARRAMAERAALVARYDAAVAGAGNAVAQVQRFEQDLANSCAVVNMSGECWKPSFAMMIPYMQHTTGAPLAGFVARQMMKMSASGVPWIV